MYLIKHYDFGVMIVDGEKHTRDLIITPTRIIGNWWRKEGHRLYLDDLKDVLSEDFEYLVIGTGYYGYMKVEEEVYRYMKKRGVKTYSAPTGEAVKKFNELVSKGYRVVGAFHLTC